MEVLDTDRKTILHIPNVNSGESTKQKYEEVNHILDQIGDVVKQDPVTGVLHVKRTHRTAKVLKVADLVEDDPKVARPHRGLLAWESSPAGRHGPDHRAGDGQGGLRLAFLRARLDRRVTGAR